jgi:CBS domain-containing protein
MALLFGFLGVLYNPFLIFIALFVWIGATHESGMVQVKSALGNIPVGRVMITDFQTLTDKNTLTDAVELILAGSQQDFPVLDHSEVVGVLTRSDLLVALAKRDPSTPGQEGPLHPRG